MFPKATSRFVRAARRERREDGRLARPGYPQIPTRMAPLSPCEAVAIPAPGAGSEAPPWSTAYFLFGIGPFTTGLADAEVEGATAAVSAAVAVGRAVAWGTAVATGAAAAGNRPGAGMPGRGGDGRGRSVQLVEGEAGRADGEDGEGDGDGGHPLRRGRGRRRARTVSGDGGHGAGYPPSAASPGPGGVPPGWPGAGGRRRHGGRGAGPEALGLVGRFVEEVAAPSRRRWGPW